MCDKKILSQLIALTKEIKLIKPQDKPSYMAQFFAGNKSPFPGMGGLGITWWHTDKGFQLCKSIASMSVNRYDTLKHGDKEKLYDVIQDAFCDICLDDEFFNGDAIFLRRQPTLFDARTIDNVEVFSKHLWKYILGEMEKSIGYWLAIYPLPRIMTESFDLGSDNIVLVKKSDSEFWGRFASEYAYTNTWDPSTGIFSGRDGTPFTTFKYETFIACGSEGTSDGAKFKSKLKIKRFLSVVFALLRIKNAYRLTKSSAQPFRHTIQFKSKSNQASSGTTISSIGELMPYYINDAVLDDKIIKDLQDWYQELSNAENDMANRIKKAAHFINNAMVADDIESFINYFISLDALFGVRGDVERTILEGVTRCSMESEWRQKILWLYDLRSELVHGGSRFEKEWKDYDRYVNHFQRHPSEDIMDVAFLCLLKILKPNLTTAWS